MFSYCGNDPINHADPSGLCANCFVGISSQKAVAVSWSGCSEAAGGVVEVVAVGSVILAVLQLSYAIAQHLENAVTEVYEYARSLVDSAASMYENHQPRVHHVIPIGDFSQYGKETTRQLREMRELLASVDMTVNDPENLIIISHGSHKSLHTKIYISNIYNIMMTAEPGNKASVRWALFMARTYVSALDQYTLGY